MSVAKSSFSSLASGALYDHTLNYASLGSGFASYDNIMGALAAGNRAGLARDQVMRQLVGQEQKLQATNDESSNYAGVELWREEEEEEVFGERLALTDEDKKLLDTQYLLPGELDGETPREMERILRMLRDTYPEISGSGESSHDILSSSFGDSLLNAYENVFGEFENSVRERAASAIVAGVSVSYALEEWGYGSVDARV